MPLELAVFLITTAITPRKIAAVVIVVVIVAAVVWYLRRPKRT